MNNLQQIKKEIESINFTGSITIRSNEFITHPISTSKKLIDLLESNQDNKGYEPYYNTLMLILKEMKCQNTNGNTEFLNIDLTLK